MTKKFDSQIIHVANAHQKRCCNEDVGLCCWIFRVWTYWRPTTQ